GAGEFPGRRAGPRRDLLLVDGRDAGDRAVDGSARALLAVRLIGHERVEADRGVLIETAGRAVARRRARDGQDLRAVAVVEGAAARRLDGRPPGAVPLVGDERLVDAVDGFVEPADGA